MAWAQATCADAPSPYNGGAVDCYSTVISADVCDDPGGGQIQCFLSTDPDLFIAIELSGSPLAFGKIDYGTTNELFCCDSTEMTNTTNTIYIEADDGADVICLHDSSHGSCLDNIEGDQYWPTASEIWGGGHADVIDTARNGGAIVDEVWGEGGDDVINTFGGADEIAAGNDDDTVAGGSGADVIGGGEGDDTIYGGPGNDTINGDAGDDVIYGETGNDKIHAGGDKDTVRGGAGDDEICGGDGGATIAVFDDLQGEGDDDCICGGDSTSNDDDGGWDLLDGDGGLNDVCIQYGATDMSVVSPECMRDRLGNVS